MTHPAEALLDALEAIDLSSALDQYDTLQVFLVERQQILDQLQKTDVAMLDDAVRAHMRTRMSKVLERDQQTLQALHAALENTRKGLEKAVHGRTASRRYAGTHEQPQGRLLNGG